jgi:pyrroline-5-carboxylate reductase
MATAMIRGWLDNGLSIPQRICTSNPPDRNTPFFQNLGLTTFGEAEAGGAEAVASSSDIILLAVKPQCMGPVLRALKPHVQPHHLVVSIAAGLKLASYEAALPAGTRVIRVMPNTPLLVGAGASAYCMGNHATEEDERRIETLLGSSGLVVKVRGGEGG